jgi:hypothetical protein
MNILIKFLATLTLFCAGLANAELCYYIYGDKTDSAEKALRWSQAGMEVKTQSCNVTPPMVPPSQQSQQRQGSKRVGSDNGPPPCDQGYDSGRRNESGGRICIVEYLAKPESQGQFRQQPPSRGGILSETLDGAAMGYAARGNRGGVRDGAEAGAARGLLRALFGQ